MCGTASVSEGLRKNGFRVIASDLMTYAEQHATVRLTLAQPPAFRGLGRSYSEVLTELNGLAPRRGHMYREYSPGGQPSIGCAPRRYLSPENAAKLDAINAHVGQWERDGALTPSEVALLRHDLVLAVNRVANIAGTYGHFRSGWNRWSLAAVRLVPSTFLSEASTDHIVTRGRAEDVARHVRADLCYLDPPYTKRQYAANYHLIETVARGDEPPAVGVSGLRPWRDQYSDFCSKLRIRDALSAILVNMDCPQFLVSYSEDGLLAKEELYSFLTTFGSVRLMEFLLTRFRSNDSELRRTVTEYLFHLERF
jgi:adenine-specific DNA-methyltransferase